MEIFDKMHRKNPGVRILCHNGATISPWWLMHVDLLSLVNSHDGAPGDRTEQMCYRDGLYYQLTEGDRNQVPLCSFFNHEPAKDGKRFGDKTIDGFRDYLFMALSRGTMTVELYVVVRSLTPEDFDVIAGRAEMALPCRTGAKAVADARWEPVGHVRGGRRRCEHEESRP